ncbi:Nonribosomal peptide synthetase [Mycena chlorophos]|uniref:Nonribosomal peptide synthetase n=1 Tax=Mycena chlorophos TaxID=658473 RepID=A0A8H6S9I8_MYCCL|nr:Nonribosomal peptide synthetase [Mycena chlorophos]
MAPFIAPPLTLPSSRVHTFIDHHRTAPNLTPAFSWGNEDGTGVTNVSHFEFARAAHRAAELLRPGRCGGAQVDGTTVAIVVATDALIAQTLLAGCIIAGLVPFPISPRNTEAALIHLLSSTRTHRILATRASVGPIVDPLVHSIAAAHPSSGYPLSIEEIPTFRQLYPFLGRETPDDAFTPYPPPSTPPSPKDPVLILHSSGSTGLPKPITTCERVFFAFCALENVSEMARRAPRAYTGMMPAFHAFGVLMQFVGPLAHGLVSCLAPPSTINGDCVPPAPTPQSTLANAKKTKVDAIVTVPAFILEWAKNEEDVEYLVSLKLLVFGSAPLASKVGDVLVRRGVKFGQVYGATEFGAVNKLVPTGLEEHEWSWMEMSERARVRWEATEKGIFEAQFLTTEDVYYPAIENLPDLKGYATRDLFERHPTKPHLYRIMGRLDDVVVLGTGEKVVPNPMEDILNASPHITGAILFGRERIQTGVLIQPSSAYAIDPRDDKQLASFRNLVWDVVEHANAVAPNFARVYKEMILLTELARPMLRSPKGSVAKKATLELYAQDIDALYNTVEASSSAAGEIASPVAWTAVNIQPWLLEHTSSLCGKAINPTIDLFEQGFDSLNATFLRHRIVGALRASPSLLPVAQQIPRNFIYTYASVQQLAHALQELVVGNAGGAKRDAAAAAMEAMIAKYSSAGLVGFLPEGQMPTGEGAVVLLTGSTGGLGSHVLELLIANPGVSKIFAFNRPNDKIPILQRQEAAFAERGLDTTALKSEKLVFLVGDSTKADLGLPAEQYAEVKRSVNTIIHNAWTLDFNKTLLSFEPHIAGTRNLIDLARAMRATPRFVFTSSVGSAQAWDLSSGPVPEEILDVRLAVGTGYGESKYVAERLLLASGLRATSLRIGQVSGSATNGAWSATEWVPAIVKSSITLGHFPADPGAVAPFLSPEAVAKAVVDVALYKEEVPAMMNVVHPRPASWNVVFGAMAKAAGVEDMIPIDQWLKEVGERAERATAVDLELVPAIKIVDFLKSTIKRLSRAEFSTVRADTVTSALREVQDWDERDAEKWVGYWRNVGFLDE